MNRFTVRTRLLIGFITIALLGALVAAIGIYNMAKMNTQAEMAYQHDLMGLSHLKEANINLIYIGRAMRGTLLSTDPAQKQDFSARSAKALSAMHDELDIARPLYVTTSGKALFAGVDRLVLEYQPIFLKTVQMSQSEEPEARRAAVDYGLGSFAEKGNQLHDALMELAHQKEQAAATAAAMAGNIYADARALMIALVLGSLAAGIGLGLWTTRSLMRQLGGEPAYAADVVASIAAGDLSHPVTTAPADKSSLLFAMEMMRTSLIKIVSQVREGTDTIATASRQIAAGNLDLSSRTEEQASSLEETASSMEELTSTVKQNANNARQANTLAVSASAVAVRGGDVVSKVVDTMASINASSRKIVDIISVIDSIAFQTNILALNAAVEAARAGEQGRGFAVVATEVRNLAQRSAAAAKEIKTLINDSVDKVDAGGKLVNQAGETMAEIVDSITRVTDIMGEIASASIEQTMGIEQINSAISQMDEVTQQNAALVEEAAAAAGSMQEQATALAEVVSIFKVGLVVTVKGIIPLRAVERVTVSVNPTARIGAMQATTARRAPMVADGDIENWEPF
ncbi:MAG: methyl-accepting chemotaxis protein [Candidatus Paceibacteria bacterium]|jgi:methyl-accepting chemotaxis protein